MAPSPALILSSAHRPRPSAGGGSVTFVGAANGGSYGSAPAAEPAGVQDNDLLVLVGCGFNDPISGGRTLAAPAGFAHLATSPGGAGCFTTVWWKARSGPGGPYQITSNQSLSWQNGTNASTAVLAFRGAGGLPQISVGHAGNNPSSSQYTIGAVSVLVDGSVLAVCVGSYNVPGVLSGAGLSFVGLAGPQSEARWSYAPASPGAYEGISSVGSDAYHDSWVAFVVSP